MELPRLPAPLAKLLERVHVAPQPQPHRDWLILLGVFIVLLALSVTWSSFFFLDVVSREPAATETEGVSADTTALEAVQRAAAGRAEETVRFENEYRFVDPSR